MARRQGPASAAVWSADSRYVSRELQVKPRSDGWASRYVTRVRWTDALIVIGAVLVAQQIRFGVPENISEGVDDDLRGDSLSYCRMGSNPSCDSK